MIMISFLVSGLALLLALLAGVAIAGPSGLDRSSHVSAARRLAASPALPNQSPFVSSLGKICYQY
jgi:hypothetical protein